MKRKHFLQSILGASAFLGLPYKTLAYDSSILQELINNTKKNINGSMFGFSCQNKCTIEAIVFSIFDTIPLVTPLDIALPVPKISNFPC